MKQILIGVCTMLFYAALGQWIGNEFAILSLLSVIFSIQVTQLKGLNDG